MLEYFNFYSFSTRDDVYWMMRRYESNLITPGIIQHSQGDSNNRSKELAHSLYKLCNNDLSNIYFYII